MSQPKWKYTGNLGDVNPIDHDGGIVLVDKTGVYAPEVEYYQRDSEADNSKITVYRFIVEDCTLINGILSDNKFHPELAVWFADRMPDNVTAEDFTSDNVMRRADAWVSIGMFHGFDELDSYPLILTEDEAIAHLESMKSRV